MVDPVHRPADCPHDTLVAATFDPPVFVPGVGHLHDLHAVYVCPVCRDTFFFEAGIKRLNRTELLKLGHGFIALASGHPNGIPALAPTDD